MYLVYCIWCSPDDGSLKLKHVVKNMCYTRKKLVANEATVFYCVLFVIHTQQGALTHN
jgi:hypothetical protein